MRLLALCFVLMGCASAQVSLRTTGPAAAGGRTVEVELSNAAWFRWVEHGVLPCTAWLETRGEGVWERVQEEPRACITLLELTRGVRPFTYRLPEGLLPGTYRVALSTRLGPTRFFCWKADDGGPNETVVTEPFAVVVPQ